MLNISFSAEIFLNSMFVHWRSGSGTAGIRVTESLCNGFCEELEWPNKHFPRVGVIPKGTSQQLITDCADLKSH